MRNDPNTSGLTKQRRAVLQVISDSKEHLNANEVFNAAGKILPGISFATVYNSLRYLRNEGLIGEVRFGNEATRYDRNLSRHDHALCRICGKLVDMDLEVPGGMLKRAAEISKFSGGTIEFTLVGLCPDCQ